MEWVSELQNAVNYIEEHITDDIDYKVVAAQSFSSSYNFQRVFSTLCGFSVGDYIRNRRLSLAGFELVTRKVKIIDVATKYGYDSPDSFTKAFKKFHGILPSQARNNGGMLKSFSRVAFKISLDGGNILNYKIKEIDEIVLTGYKRRFVGKPVERAEQEENMYINTRHQQKILADYAEDMQKDYNVITNADDNGYDFYIANKLINSMECDLNEHFSQYEDIIIPKCTYAVFETPRCIYPTLMYLDLRRKISSEWLPYSGYRECDLPEIVVTHWYDGAGRNKRYRELWIPITKCE